MPFDLENKITWKELAPSLQSLFKTLQQQITKNANDIEDLNNRLDDLWEQMRTSIVPIGFIIPSQRVIPGWVKLDGSLYPREKYPDLYNYAVNNNLIVDDNTWANNNSRGNSTCEHISYRGFFSYGDGSTTFRVPDLRACFIRGTDDNRGYDVGRIHMSEQLATLVGGCYDDNRQDNDVGHLRTNGSVWRYWGGDLFDMTQYAGASLQDVIWCRIGNEHHYSYGTANNWYSAVRPRNVAYYWIMKAEFGLDLSAGDGTGGGNQGGDIDTNPGEGDVEPPDPDGSQELEDRLNNIDPIGTIKYSYTIPDGWMECNGSLLSRTDYSDLYTFAESNNLLISDSEWNNNNQGKFSYGDGSSNFRIPDFRGKFIRSLDSGAGIDGGRIIGSYQMDAQIKTASTIDNLVNTLNQTVAIRGNNQVNGDSNWVSSLPTFADSWEYFKKNEGNRHAYYRNAFAQIPGTRSLAEEYDTSLMADNGRTNTDGPEVRPLNIALRVIIKASIVKSST